MCEALDDHEDSVSIKVQFIANFCFVDDVIAHAEEDDVLVDRLDTTTTRYKTEISRE